jgi:hypothetical protein
MSLQAEDHELHADNEHGHSCNHHLGHAHMHGIVDLSILSTDRGIRAVSCHLPDCS